LGGVLGRKWHPKSTISTSMGNDGLDTPQEKLTADTAGNIDKYTQEGGPKPPILGVPAVSFRGVRLD